jgi:hypothetical protein
VLEALGQAAERLGSGDDIVRSEDVSAIVWLLKNIVVVALLLCLDVDGRHVGPGFGLLHDREKSA